jgi:cell wall-associated NlpC family hydrolase
MAALAVSFFAAQSVPTHAVPALAAPAASSSSPAAATTTKPKSFSVQEAVSLALIHGQELAVAELDLHDALLRSTPVSAQSTRLLPSLAQRSQVLKGLRLNSPTALRKAAHRLRTPGADKESNARHLSNARQALDALYPWAPAINDAGLPLVLEAAATEHDRRALEEAETPPVATPVPLSSLTAGEMIIRSSNENKSVSVTQQLALVASLHDRYATSLKEAAHAALLASRQSAARRAKRAGVLYSPSRAASAAITSMSRSEAVGLAASWTQAGYRRSNAVLTALAQVGKTYRFANRGPDAFDCSGLTSFAWANSGLDLRTSSFSQRAQVESLGSRPRDVRPGDLVFYKVRQNRAGDPSGHVAMVLGYMDLVVEAQARADQVQVAPYIETLLSSFGRVRLAGERTDGLLLATRSGR